ncbi:MAG: fluoride efflux transporter FluC [Microbacterium gubbeenense]|uniref:fluoride efflux transporter FluC n=1 Tax=Microbacterium gubbeenense TaxID=159896 RepID=UPI003F98F7E6
MSVLLLALAVGAAGGVGSMLRYLVDNSVPARLRRRYPWGILLVNLTGSFALGAMTGAVSGDWATILGAGLLGGYTTFSTASVDAARLLLERRITAAVLGSVATLAACVAVAGGGYALFAS